MKTSKPLFALLLLAATFRLFAQNPLVGTWELSTDSSRSVKVITPTHWMVFSEAIKGDSIQFTRAHGGTYTVNGNKYVENITVASWDNYGKEKTNFTWQVNGDTFHQKGMLTLADGTEVPIDENWQRVNLPAQPNKEILGTWNQLSSSYTMADGKKGSHTNATDTRFQIVTPTHWMRISHHDKKFENAMGGTYTVEGNKITSQLGFASFPLQNTNRAEFTYRLEGDKIYLHGDVLTADGSKTMSFEDVFQKVKAKSNKIASAK